MHRRHVLLNQLFPHQTHRIVTANLIMYRNGMGVGIAGQRFADRQFECRKSFKTHLLRELHHAGLADARLRGQLLRTEMTRSIRLGKEIIRQFFIALREVRVTLTNAN